MIISRQNLNNDSRYSCKFIPTVGIDTQAVRIVLTDTKYTAYSSNPVVTSDKFDKLKVDALASVALNLGTVRGSLGSETDINIAQIADGIDLDNDLKYNSNCTKLIGVDL